jgi:hypothetical protein
MRENVRLGRSRTWKMLKRAKARRNWIKAEGASSDIEEKGIK